jgi:putative addiction module component (TIGR02574 family)
MAHTLPLPPPGFDDLPLEDQIDYIQSLWDRIAASADQLPLREWQAKLLDERLAEFRADPEAGDPADKVLQRLLERYPSAS